MTEGSLVPLYGFVEGDTLGLLVLVRSTDTIATLAATLREAAAVRVAAPLDAGVFARGRRLPPDATVARVGLAPLERVDLKVDRKVES